MRRLPLALGWAAALAVGPVLADGITLDPQTVRLPADAQASEIWLDNRGEHPWSASARIYRWSQPDDSESLAATADIAVSPQHFSIAPHGRQRLRLVRLGAIPTQETGYRLVIEEATQATAAPDQPLLRYSTAVFLDPAGPSAAAAAPQVEITLAGAGASPALRLRNSGSSHARLSDLAYVDAAGARQVLIQGLAGYILAGARRTWPLPPRDDGYLHGRFEARIGDQPAAALPAVAPEDQTGL